MREALLRWYDQNARVLPWRDGPESGVVADPYRVWVSEVMLQQTTVPHALPYFEKFMALWPTVADLAGAADERVMAEWAGLGYYSRARNLLKCARAVVSEHGGVFPADEAALLKLPSFGPYTAAAVMAFAFGKPANVVDGNIERIMSRVYSVKVPMPQAKGMLRDLAAQWVRPERARDWPQALMDLASAVCRPKSPLCMLCPLREGCAGFAEGTPEIYPLKAPKAAKPVRYGVAFLIVCDEGVVVERRPDKGLLGGMLGLPHLEWRAEVWGEGEALLYLPTCGEGDRSLANGGGGLFETGDGPPPSFLRTPPPPQVGEYKILGAYSHVFTHFALKQQVWRIGLTDSEMQAFLRAHNRYQLLKFEDASALPTVFAKALKF